MSRKTDKLEIDLQSLIAALQSNNEIGQDYLNLKTGEIEMILDDLYLEEDPIKKNIENNLDDFEYIDPIPSWVSYNLMVKFTETLESESIKNYLASVLNKRKPFYNFKNALLNYPKIRQKWFTFHDKKMEEMAKEWLKAHDIKADLV